MLFNVKVNIKNEKYNGLFENLTAKQAARKVIGNIVPKCSDSEVANAIESSGFTSGLFCCQVDYDSSVYVEKIS